MPDPCRLHPAPVLRPRAAGRGDPRPGPAPLGGARCRGCVAPAPVPVLVAALAAAVLLAVAAAPGTAAEGSVAYAPPVGAPVVDPFRPPEHAYGPGNRGLEYATTPGQAVGAVGRGTVVFAGSVAGRLVVSVEHPDGLRSSLTGLAAVEVAVGRPVGSGERVGTAGARLHLGVRRGEAYLDPLALFALANRGRAWLVPEVGDRSVPEAVDRPSAPGRAEHAGRHLAAVACPPACKPA